MVDKENRLPKSRGSNQAMDSLAGGVLQNNGQKRVFRSKVQRSSLESTRSTNSRLKQTDSLATMGKIENKSVGNDSNSSLVSSMNDSKGRRRRGRCNHPVSSLAHTGNCDTKTVTAVNANQRRKPAVSSLMNLSSSTQKPRATSNQSPANESKNELDLIHNIQSMNLNDSQNRTFSSPTVLKQRPFATAGECTSPPGVLHRLSTLSSNFFSPLTTPGSVKARRKRRDQKETPMKLTGFEEILNDETIYQNGPSPIITEMSVSPRICRRQRKSEIINNPKHIADGKTEFNDCEASFDCGDAMTMSPSINPHQLEASPPLSTINQADKLGNDGFLCAKANLFPTANEPAARSKTATSENIRGSSVIFVEAATPRLIKPTSLLNETSDGDANEPGNKTRGSLVFSLQKAPPLPKPMQTKPKSCRQGLSGNEKEKTLKGKTGQKQKFSSASHKCDNSTNHTESKVHATLGTRRSARESKQTDRFTVESWDNADDKRANFTKGVTSEVLSREQSNDDVELEVLLAKTVVEKSGNNIARGNAESYQAPTQIERVVSNQSDIIVSDEDRHWSAEELSLLRDAQSTVDPTLSSYWGEIATIVESKSAPECREKWFSLVATPRGPPSKENKSEHAASKTKTTSTTDASDDEEDDLFHSTPMRETLHDARNNALSKQLNQSCFFEPSLGLSPCAQSDAATQKPGSACLNVRRVGYKTYIDKLRKDLRPAQNDTKKAAQHTHLKGYASAHLQSGDWGKVMEDGTVQLTIHEESEQEEDDIFDEDNEDC